MALMAQQVTSSSEMTGEFERACSAHGAACDEVQFEIAGLQPQRRMAGRA